VVVTALVAFVTIAMVAYDAIGVMRWEHEHKPVGPPSGYSYMVFDTCLLLMVPADGLAHALGIDQSLGYWGWRLLAIALNTVIAFGLGNLIGWLVVGGRFFTRRLMSGGNEV
jgi:hypothetical protein